MVAFLNSCSISSLFLCVSLIVSLFVADESFLSVSLKGYDIWWVLLDILFDGLWILALVEIVTADAVDIEAQE